MREKTLHTVIGTGVETNSDPDPERPLDPRHFEQALNDLQEFIAALNRVAPNDITSVEKTAEPGHDVEDSQIRISEDTALESVYDILPEAWDASVLIDEIQDAGYAVHSGVYCGGGAEVRLTVFIQTGIISRLDFKYTDLTGASGDGYVTVRSEHVPMTASRTAEVMRMLSDAAMHGYTASLSSPVRALDYAMASSRPLRSTRVYSERDDCISQTSWAGVRGTTKQTISNNLKAARDELKDLPDIDPFVLGMEERSAALDPVDADSDVKPDLQLV